MTPEEEANITRLAAVASAEVQTAPNAPELDQVAIEDVAAALLYISDHKIDPKLSPQLQRCIARDLFRCWARRAAWTATPWVLGALAAEALTTLFGGRYGAVWTQERRGDWCRVTSSAPLIGAEREDVTSRYRQSGNH